MLRHDLLRRIAFFLALALITTPVWGYVVFLRDGTQIITREKYRRDGDKVFLVLQSGTETFIDAAEIDFPRTDKLNEENVGLVRVIEGSADTRIVEEKKQVARKPTLQDLASGTRLAAREPRQTRTTGVEEDDGEPTTRAGFVDLRSVQRKVHPDGELVSELSTFLESQGAEGFQIFQGTAEDRVLLHMTANSESTVFKGMRDAAAGLVHVQTRWPSRVGAVELLLSTESARRAGQFVLTRKLADQLLSGAIDAPTFFHRFVQF